ncbi:MAG: TraR/DksA C4-type zinc finger protein [Gemmatimonadota bacterium]|jgi:RNA polymerase-binding transcription factor DksA|nr:TraR/DksA C4-type zinc finger protein [Gemmatimonadota bacterium]
MLTPEERDQLERGLQNERARAVSAMRDFDRNRETSMLDGTGELTMYRLHPADIGTEAMEREKQFLLASVEGRRLTDIDDALRRLYREPGSYGVCGRCGEEIGFERLSVLPYAALCTPCQVSTER